MEGTLAPIASLDTQLISNLSLAQHQAGVEELTRSLRNEGYAVAITGTVLSELEVTDEFADHLLETGFAFRAAVFLGIANQYDRIERATRKFQTKADGSLSDMPILSESAYFDLVVTMDEDFGRAGALLKGFIPTPAIRYVDIA